MVKCLVTLAALVFFALRLNAFECPKGEPISRIEPIRPLIFSEIESNLERVDNLSHFEIIFNHNQYKIDRNMTLSKVDKGGILSLATFKEDFQGPESYFAMGKFKDYFIFVVGYNDYNEGLISNIYLLNSNDKGGLIQLNKCSNQKDFLGVRQERLIYTCEYQCNAKAELYQFDEKQLKFSPIQSRKQCKEILNLPSSMQITLNSFQPRRKKDKNGKEYQTSFFPLDKRNCKP